MCVMPCLQLIEKSITGTCKLFMFVSFFDNWINFLKIFTVIFVQIQNEMNCFTGELNKQFDTHRIYWFIVKSTVFLLYLSQNCF